MTLPQILNVTAAFVAARIGWSALYAILAEHSPEPEPEPVSPIMQAKSEAVANRAALDALSQVDALPRARSRR
jgi:hypothetical protein